MSSDPLIGVLFLADSLGLGGAERQLVELATRIDRSRFQPQVLVWEPGRFFDEALAAADVPLRRMDRKGRLDLRPVLETRRALRSGEVQIVHAFLSTGNLYAVVGRRLARRGIVIASEWSQEYRLAGLSRFHKGWALSSADVALSNSAAGTAFVERLIGDPDLRTATIPTGIDLARFNIPSQAERLALRSSLGWTEDETVMLTVSRLDPIKNHLGLLKALEDIPDGSPSWRACWVGDSSTEFGASVRESVRLSPARDRIDLLPPTHDVERFYHAADVLVLSSDREGLPNVILESLACGLPIVSTDVGDVGQYVREAETGWLLSPRDVEALTGALTSALACGQDRRREMGEAGRRSMVDLGMDVDTMVRRHEVLYERLIRERL